MAARNYASHLRRLKKHLKLRVTIRLTEDFAKLTGDAAQQYWDEGAKRFYIYIDAGLTDREKRDALLHEWAHCLAHGKEDKDHDEHWGLAMSAVYRVAVDGWKPRR